MATVDSLATLCVVVLIDHRDLLGDLGDMDLSLMRPVFEHCTADQLDRIENENKDLDFTEFTDDLWQRCYERRYGGESVQEVQERMKQAKVLYTWRQLYHARQEADDRTQQKCVSRLKELYHQAQEVKKQRQLRVLEKRPRLSVTPRRRMFSSGPSSAAAAWADRAGSSILKKARLGYAGSVSAKLVSEIKRRPLNYSPPRSHTNTHRPSSLTSSPATPPANRAFVTSPAVTRQSGAVRSVPGQLSANLSLQARLAPSGRADSEPQRAVRGEARGHSSEQARDQARDQARAAGRDEARGSSRASILNIVGERRGVGGAVGGGGGGAVGGGGERGVVGKEKWDTRMGERGGERGGDRGGERGGERWGAGNSKVFPGDRSRHGEEGFREGRGSREMQLDNRRREAVGDKERVRNREAGSSNGRSSTAAGDSRGSSGGQQRKHENVKKKAVADGSKEKRKAVCTMDWGV